MAKGNRAACLAVTFPHEGGYVDHPKDPGGATNLGITLATLSAWRKRPVTKAEVKALTKVEAEAIYGANYWNPLRCEDLPFGVDLATFDYGVNSGISRSAKALQFVLGVSADGRIGSDTVKAAVLANGKATIQKLCASRLGFVRSLKTWATFGKGWGRRIADVEAKAVAMYLARGGSLSAPARRELELEGKKAGDTAKAQNKGVGLSAAGGGGAAGGEAMVSAEPNWLLIVSIIVVVTALAAALLVKARHNKARSEAYESVSASAD
ncbi:MAG: hypothetical protein KYX69_19780 [Sphingomonas sp.]|uniref:glycoside hydrolase family 108 protein n=1 Tax=Sphingomonas sp. TaxID=28214 RepID=UPI002619A70E|nr:glycosyl hydrolase 108 family protein [Sphingomonas sp.]MDK2769945.1 hypothetical protein [Sphingomonas sp.]